MSYWTPNKRINELKLKKKPDPKIWGFKTWNPEVPNLKKTTIPTSQNFEKRIPGSLKDQSRNPKLKNTWSLSPDKGPIPPHRK